jgi:hypothetical protein
MADKFNIIVIDFLGLTLISTVKVGNRVGK